MKTYRIIIVVLLLIVGWLAYELVAGRERSGAPQPAELWHTNAVEVWHTNTIDVWHTNTVEAPLTNTVVQTVTNVVTKEVPASLTALQRKAATTGYKYLNAPQITNPTDALYKASPLALSVDVAPNAAQVLKEDANSLRQTMSRILSSLGIPVAQDSPYHLRLRLSAPWRTDVPNVQLIDYRLELNQTVAAQRQDDLLRMRGTLWSSDLTKLVNLSYLPEDADSDLQQLLDQFKTAYQKAKADEQSVSAQLPTIPSDFLPEGK